MKRRYIMEQSGWMIVKRETTATEIKNCIKRFFYNIFNKNSKKTNISKTKTVEKAEKKEIVIEYLS